MLGMHCLMLLPKITTGEPIESSCNHPFLGYREYVLSHGFILKSVIHPVELLQMLIESNLITVKI